MTDSSNLWATLNGFSLFATPSRSQAVALPYLPPVAPPQAVPVTLEPASGTSMSESATVLLVDNETALVHAIGEFLRECGYNSPRSALSAEALSLLSAAGQLAATKRETRFLASSRLSTNANSLSALTLPLPQ